MMGLLLGLTESLMIKMAPYRYKIGENQQHLTVASIDSAQHHQTQHRPILYSRTEVDGINDLGIGMFIRNIFLCARDLFHRFCDFPGDASLLE